MSASSHRLAGFRWAYSLALLPLLTEWMEEGRMPASPRAWLTEIVLGCVVLGFVHTLVRQAGRLESLSFTDSLTGLPNRRAFDSDLEREVARARRNGAHLALAFLDVDRFKEVNDRFGHDAGDALLRHVGGVLRREAREGNDFGYRLGGDEFALLMTGSGPARAAEAVRRLRELALGGPGGLKAFDADLSVGYVEIAPGESLPEFYKRADDAMYAVKLDRRRVTRSASRPASPSQA